MAASPDNYLERYFNLLGVKLRQQRVRRGHTQEDMIGFGFSARHWQQVEAGRAITVTTLLRACDALEIKPSTMLRRVERDLSD